MLLRIHHNTPVRGGGEDEGPATKLLMVQKWSILWRSIIASSLKSTLFPYCRYIKALDFRDLENLFEDDKFRAKISKSVVPSKTEVDMLTNEGNFLSVHWLLSTKQAVVRMIE